MKFRLPKATISAAGDRLRSRKLQSTHVDNCGPLLRLLEAQLQTQSRQHKDELEALHTQIELLKDDIEKKQELLSYTAALSPEAKVEYSVQQEITRLTNDNLVKDSVQWVHIYMRCVGFILYFFSFSYAMHYLQS